MIKELKFVFYLLIIFFFIFFTVRFYLSDENIKKTNLSILNIENKIELNQDNLKILTNDTENIIEYAEKDTKEKDKNYFFWKLLN
tara:strand:- start:2563 stop:2817 length:255 start_codon:yes stop_codon:yes gene_type:complete